MASASSLPVLYLARIIDGITAGNLSLAQAYISDNTTPENRTRSFAIIGVAFGIGFFLGPWVTGYLVRYGLHAPILLAAGMSLISVLCTAVLLPGGRPPQEPAADGVSGVTSPRPGRFDTLRKKPALWGLWAQFFMFSLAFSLFTSGFALFAERRFTWHGQAFGPREIGYLFAYSGFLGILLQGGLIGRLVRNLGEAKLARAGFLAAAVAYVALAFAREIPHLVMVASVSAFGNGVLRPVLTGQVSQVAGPREQGTVLGINQSLASLASVIAPLLSGFLITQQYLSAWALCAAGACTLGLLFALRFTTTVAPAVPQS
jgi:MFS family permease